MSRALRLLLIYVMLLAPLAGAFVPEQRAWIRFTVWSLDVILWLLS